MRLNCYACKTTPLLPTKLDDLLPALACQSCDGVYLDLLTYRHWREHQPVTANSEQDNEAEFNIDELSNSDGVLVCQRCQKFMLKYRISNEHDNTINVCSTCDDVWLDSGEWRLLKALELQDKLTELMGEPWQQHLRDEQSAKSFTKLYQDKLGEDFDTVETFATWLQDHDNKAEIRHYLSQR